MTRSAVHKFLRRRWWWKLALVALWAVAIIYLLRPVVTANRFVTLHKVLTAGELTIITRYSPHCYYTYRDQPMGFEYDLAREFADYLGVKLKVTIADNWSSMLHRLLKGQGAIIAASFPVTAERRKAVAFSNGYMEIRPHLIVRRNDKTIGHPEELDGEIIDVHDNADFTGPLDRIRGSGIDVQIRRHKKVPTEDLIRQVVEGSIDFTVAQSHTALLNRRHYPEAKAAIAVGEPQWLAWASAPGAEALQKEINRFFEQVMTNGKFDEVYKKYYGNIHEFDYVDLRTFHRRIKTRLSRYSPFIKEAAQKYGFDWRLIAAQIYQESHLHPWAHSTAGAKGLMQLLPETARSLGVTDIYNPVENINAGVRHMSNLYEQFNKIAGQDRLLISLAAYNTGIGHIWDAQQLAVRLEMNPNRWASLSKTLPMLKYRKYYKDAKHGYCRGDEPVAYIRQILIYHDILKRQGMEYGSSDSESG